ncbi:Olfactory receptor 4E1 [Lemmus lemmus]
MAVFFMFLIFYVLTLVGNILIVITIIYDRRLHTPMYFFLSNLSFIDVCHSTVTVPKMLRDTFSEEKLIPFDACVVQMFFLHLFACTEIFLLTVMAYDRYVAICKPLQYMTIMNWKVCMLLTGALWTGGTIHSISLTSLTINLPYCGPDEIDNFFCDIPAVLRLACADTTVNELVTFVDIGVVATSCFMLILLSYANIVLAILKIRTADGRRRAFSTCGSHLTVVTVSYVPCIFIYLRAGSKSPLDGAVAVFYTVVTPLLNPLIYTLRNQEVKSALKRLRAGRRNVDGEK